MCLESELMLVMPPATVTAGSPPMIANMVTFIELRPRVREQDLRAAGIVIDPELRAIDRVLRVLVLVRIGPAGHDDSDHVRERGFIQPGDADIEIPSGVAS